MARPERTCVACRATTEADDLVRLARSPDGERVVDLRGNLPGRGAWIHPRRECVAEVVKRPDRLRRALDVDSAGLAEDLDRHLHAALGDGLSQAAAAGALVGGAFVLEEALREGRILALIAAQDAADRSIKAARALGPELPFLRIPLDREALGRRIGRGDRALVGVLASRAANHLLRQLRRLVDLG